MKNTLIFLGIMLIISLSCKAQIIAVEDFPDYNKDLEDGAYIKDINNVLDKYTGTWAGHQNDTIYQFVVDKYTDIDERLKYTHDRLIIKYKITNSDGEVIEDTTNLPDESTLVMFGRYLSKQGQYVLYYQGSNSDCGQNGDVFLSVLDRNSNKMNLSLSVDGEVWFDCTTGPAEQVLPTGKGIILTKQ